MNEKLLRFAYNQFIPLENIIILKKLRNYNPPKFDWDSNIMNLLVKGNNTEIYNIIVDESYFKKPAVYIEY